MSGSEQQPGGRLSLQTFAAFELRDFRLLWANNFSYALVQGIERFAFVWLVIETLQEREFFLGLVSFALGIPVFFLALPAGVLSDRWDRRRLLFISQAIVLVAALLTAILIWMDLMTLRVALVMALFVGTGVAVGQPVRQALIPAVVPPKRLMNAITLNGAGQTISQMVGPALGGAAIALWGIGGNFALQAILMGVGVIFIIPLRIPARGPSPAVAAAGRSALGGILSDVVDGFRFIIREPNIRVLFLLLLLSSLIINGPWVTLLPKVAQVQLDATAFWASMLFTYMGVGLTISSLILASIPRLGNAGGWFTCALMTSSGLAVIIGFSESYLLTSVLMFMTGLSAAFFMNLNLTLIQSHTPAAVMGRVMAIFTLVMMGATPVGGLIGGLGAEWLGAGGFFSLCGGASVALGAVFLLTQPGLRRMPSHPEVAVAAPAESGSG